MKLSEILTDMLLTIRGAKISQSERITDAYLLFHLNNYRAKKIVESVAKYEVLDRIHIQSLQCISLDTVDISECPTIHNLCKYFLRTEPLPIPINAKNGPLITFIGDIEGTNWQLTTEENLRFMKQRKYTGGEIMAFWKDYRLYVASDKALDRLTVRGVFEDPTALADYPDNCNDMANYTYDSQYPLSNKWYPEIKSLILRNELKIVVESPSDNKNDGQHSVQSNIEREVAR